jgi:hypothetical protein
VKDALRDEKYTNIFVGRPEAKRPLGRPSVDWRIYLTLKWILYKQGATEGNGITWFRTDSSVMASCEHGNEHLDHIKDGITSLAH